jgi:nitrogen regulatory protein PII
VEAKMKSISIVLLMSVIRLLIQGMELLNKIPENDYREVVLSSQKRKDCIKGIVDNAQRGNIFMVLFFTRELLEAVRQES